MQAEQNRPGRPYLPCLTGLRGVAAGWVVLLHLWLLAEAPRVAPLGLDLTPLFASGGLGVDLFFVLSGFLLGRPFMAWAAGRRPFPNLIQFWKRRCLRVLPAYYLQLALLIVAGFFIAGHLPVDFGQFLAYLSMEFLWYPHTGPLLNNVWWSLPVEWNFYVVLPLLALGFARMKPWLMVVLVLAWVIGFRIILYDSLFSGIESTWFGYGLIPRMPARIDEFVFGLLAARAHLHRPGPSRGRTLGLLTGLVGMAAVAIWLDGRGDILAKADAPWIFVHFSLVGAFLALIVLGAAAGGRLARALFAGRALAFLGLISYSLYLWHAIVFQVAYRSGFIHWPPASSLIGMAAFLVPVVLFVSWLSYHVSERPFLVTAPAAAHEAHEQTASAGTG